MLRVQDKLGLCSKTLSQKKTLESISRVKILDTTKITTVYKVRDERKSHESNERNLKEEE